MNFGAGNVYLMRCFLENVASVSAAYLKHTGLQIGAKRLGDGENGAQNFTKLMPVSQCSTLSHLPFKFHLM